MAKVNLSYKKFLLYIITLLLWAIPLFIDTPNGTYEIIWLFYLIPPILIAYLYGYKGGAIAGIFGVLLQLSFETAEYFFNKEEFKKENFIVVFTIAVGITAVTMSMVTLLRNVEQEKKKLEKMSQKLEFLANHDELTTLPNRRAFERHLTDALLKSKESNRIIALVFFDLDRLKYLNDTAGHSTGDLVICEIANRLKQSVQTHGFLSRFGGDEFTLLFDNLSTIDEIKLIIQKIISSIERPITLNHIDYKVTASLGIALSPQDSVISEILMKCADTAMYQAKAQGGSNYAFYTHQMSEKLNRQTLLEQNLKDALEMNQFTLFYQPLWDIKTGRVISAEALIRWEHPKLGLIPPDEFIPLAEETGLIIPIGEWVLRTAVKEAQKWHKSGYSIKISVNFSSIQLQKPNCIQVIQKILEETGFPSQLLELEITERIALSNPKEVLEKLKNLRSIGVQIAIDDFGIGYSSLSYLKKYPINTIKIDRTFVQDIALEPLDKAMLESMLIMARNLNFDTIAEGVETKEQFEILEKLGCQSAQGYYFSRPLPSVHFLNFIELKKAELSSLNNTEHLEIERCNL